MLFKMTPPLGALLSASAQPQELSFPGLPGLQKQGEQTWVLEMLQYEAEKEADENGGPTADNDCAE